MKKVIFLFAIFFVFLLSITNLQIVSSQTQNLGEKINEAISKKLIIPSESEKIIKEVLKIPPEENLTNEKIIVIGCILLVLIIVVQNILTITPFFEGIKSWLGAIIITLLMGITGSIYSTTLFLFHTAEALNILKKGNILALVFILLLIFAFFYGAWKITKILKDEKKKEQAELLGIKAGTAIKKLKIMGNTDEE